MSGAMQLNLTDEEAAALINLLTGIIEADQSPTSPRIETLRQNRPRLPGIRMKRHARRGVAKLQHPTGVPVIIGVTPAAYDSSEASTGATPRSRPPR